MAPPKYGVPTWAPGDDLATCTPDDNNDIPNVPAQGALVFVGTGGNVSVDGAKSGTSIVYKNVPSGTWMPIRVKRVRGAGGGTTATDIVVSW